MKGKYLSSTKSEFNKSKCLKNFNVVASINITSVGEVRGRLERNRISFENRHFLDRLQNGPCN